MITLIKNFFKPKNKDYDIRIIHFEKKKSQLIISNAFKEGINLKKHAAFIYALKGYSGKKATDVQYRCCRSKMAEDLIELNPKMIICMGEMAFKNHRQ